MAIEPRRPDHTSTNCQRQGPGQDHDQESQRDRAQFLPQQGEVDLSADQQEHQRIANEADEFPGIQQNQPGLRR
jgi:hypothetical protein